MFGLVFIRFFVYDAMYAKKNKADSMNVTCNIVLVMSFIISQLCSTRIRRICQIPGPFFRNRMESSGYLEKLIGSAVAQW